MKDMRKNIVYCTYMQIYWSNSVLILSLCGFFKPQGGFFQICKSEEVFVQIISIFYS